MAMGQRRGGAGISVALALASPALGQTPAAPPPTQPPLAAPLPTAARIAALPWMDRALDADRRAALMVAAMTQEEKLQLVHGTGRPMPGVPGPSAGGAGYVPGIPRLGLPDLNLADSSVGVTRGGARSRYATLLPASVAEAASWDPALARDYGALIGRELRAHGFNASLAGGVNLIREPRNGRVFEYRSEDPVLAGTMAGQFQVGLQSEHVVGDIKHFAFNDQEIGRTTGAVKIGRGAARESDLLAFEIAIRDGQPGMAMCSYNKVEVDWACENDWLLNGVLKGAFGFKGFVLSDWGGTHSTAKAALAGLDQEQPGQGFLGPALGEAIAAGAVPQARLDDMARRIVRTMIAAGVVDSPPQPMVVDVARGLEVAQRAAEAGIVLLKNDGVLPLARTAGSILVIGSHADVGVLTGGGSAQVDPPGGDAVHEDASKVDLGPAGIFARAPVWWPSSPLNALRAALPGATIGYDGGADQARAAAAAATAGLAIVFVNQPAREGADAATLALPDDQDALVAAVAAANPRTIVVLETGGPVTMPWLGQVRGVVAAWYPGARGGEAIARLLTGAADFTAKLPMSFPAREADLPNPVVPGSTLPPIPLLNPDGTQQRDMEGHPRTTLPAFDIPYPEGADVGYRWFERTGAKPLFAFGHGLSYTRFGYTGLTLAKDAATFTVRNDGARTGVEIAQVYAAVPGRTRRLVGWTRVALQPGEAKAVTVRFEPLALSVFDEKRNAWTRPHGRASFTVGGASDEAALSGSLAM